MSIRSLARLALVGLALSTAACTANSDPEPVVIAPGPGPSTGTYTLLWTIGESTSPAACAAIGADSMELVIYTSAGPSAPILAPCENFAMSVELSPGVYNADATLVTFDGSAVTPTLQLNSLSIVAGTSLTSDTDF